MKLENTKKLREITNNRCDILNKTATFNQWLFVFYFKFMQRCFTFRN